MKVVTTLLSFFALAGALPAPAADVYWWLYAQSDCGYDDVSPQPACGAAHKHDIEGLKACCAATTGCGGFNTNGIIKKADCVTNVQDEPACDLYVKQDHPRPEPLFIWPRPATAKPGSGAATVVPSAHFFSHTSSASSPLLAAAFERYAALTFPHAADTDMVKAAAGARSGIVGLALSVDSLEEAAPTITTDESYTLEIPAGSAATATATAKTVYGALRALETFSQLVSFDFDSNSYVLTGGVPYSIEDAPRFAHRGLSGPRASNQARAIALEKSRARSREVLSFRGSASLFWQDGRHGAPLPAARVHPRHRRLAARREAQRAALAHGRRPELPGMAARPQPSARALSLARRLLRTKHFAELLRRRPPPSL